MNLPEVDVVEALADVERGTVKRHTTAATDNDIFECRDVDLQIGNRLKSRRDRQ